MKNNNDQIVLDRAVAEAMQICDSLDIPYGNVDSFTVNYRAKSRWGQCRRKAYGRLYSYSINISADLLKSEESHIGLVSTVVHELLHTCPNCMKHTGEWKMYADKVNAAYGYKGISITRCKSAEELGVTKRYTVASREYKYGVACPVCGMTVKYMKRSKAVMHPEWFRCGRCNSENLYVVTYGMETKRELNTKGKTEFYTPYTRKIERMINAGSSSEDITNFMYDLFVNGKINYTEWCALESYAGKKEKEMTA